MSLRELLEAVRELSDAERDQVRELIDSLDSVDRVDRYHRLRGAVEKRIETISLENFKATRREVWSNLSN